MGMSTFGKEDLSLPPIYKDGKINKELFIVKPEELPKLNLNYKSFQDKANFAFATIAPSCILLDNINIGISF